MFIVDSILSKCLQFEVEIQIIHKIRVLCFVLEKLSILQILSTPSIFHAS